MKNIKVGVRKMKKEEKNGMKLTLNKQLKEMLGLKNILQEKNIY